MRVVLAYPMATRCLIIRFTISRRTVGANTLDRTTISWRLSGREADHIASVIASRWRAALPVSLASLGKAGPGSPGERKFLRSLWGRHFDGHLPSRREHTWS